MHFCWTSSVLSSFNLVKKLPNSVIKIKCVENRLYDRKNASNFNNNKCIRGTYHRQTDETPRTIFVKIHRPVHTGNVSRNTALCNIINRRCLCETSNAKKNDGRSSGYESHNQDSKWSLKAWSTKISSVLRLFVCIHTMTMLTKKQKNTTAMDIKDFIVNFFFSQANNTKLVS